MVTTGSPTEAFLLCEKKHAAGIEPASMAAERRRLGRYSIGIEFVMVDVCRE